MPEVETSGFFVAVSFAQHHLGAIRGAFGAAMLGLGLLLNQCAALEAFDPLQSCCAVCGATADDEIDGDDDEGECDDDDHRGGGDVNGKKAEEGGKGGRRKAVAVRLRACGKCSAVHYCCVAH